MVPFSVSLADIYERRTQLGTDFIPDVRTQKLVAEIIGLVTSRDYSRVPHFDATRKRPSGPHIPFRVTARPSKLGFAKGLDEVRKLFNKLTGSKASVLLPILASELEKLKTFADFCQETVLETIFGIVCSTPFYSRMYAQYYSALAGDQPYLIAEIPKTDRSFQRADNECCSGQPQCGLRWFLRD